MNVEYLVSQRAKSCFSCLKLKTGCYLIGVLYLIMGFMYFLEQLIYAIEAFSEKTPFHGVHVLINYDITPVAMMIQCGVFIYGLYSHKLFFIFQGIPVLTLCLFLEIFSLIDEIVDYVQGLSHFDKEYVFDLVMYSVLHVISLVIILTYRRQILATNGPERIESNGTTTFHEVENTLANIQQPVS